MTDHVKQLIKKLEREAAILLDAYSSSIEPIHQERLKRQHDRKLAEIVEWKVRLAAVSENTSPRVDVESPPSKPPATGLSSAPTLEKGLGTGKRWAVLAGAMEYDNGASYGALDVCLNDVNAVRNRLLAGGYEEQRVALLADDAPEPPTRNRILMMLEFIARQTQSDDLLLFYYTGHGDYTGSESYLVARDGYSDSLSKTAVSLTDVKEIVQRAKARAKVIIIDACHSGVNLGVKGGRPMSPEFIQRVFEQAEGMAILASCKQGERSYVWAGEQASVFTHYLIEALEGKADRDAKELVTVQDVNRYVLDGVQDWALRNRVTQTPTLECKVAGDIILVDYRKGP